MTPEEKEELKFVINTAIKVVIAMTILFVTAFIIINFIK